MSRAPRLVLALGLCLACLATTPAAITYPAPPASTPLVSATGTVLGMMDVRNDADGIDIRLVCLDGWALATVKLHASPTLAGIPTNKPGNPVLGHFAIQDGFLPAVQEEVYRIDATGLAAGDPLFIAAFVDLTRSDDGRSASAWAAGAPLGKRSATYFTYTMQAPIVFPRLPDSVTFYADHYANGTTSPAYWKADVRAMDPADGSYDLALQPYLAWCLEKHVTMEDHRTYTGVPRDSLGGAEALTPRFAAMDFPAINWVLNHKGGIAGDLALTRNQLQDVIWNLAGESLPLSAQGEELLQQAQGEAAGWEPGDGDTLGIILDVPGKQGIIIEILIMPPPMDWYDHDNG